ncbi:MAG: ABC transporter permease [Propionibacteriaceae bacterium]
MTSTMITSTGHSAAQSREPFVGGFAAHRIFVRRSLVHALRDGESLLMALALPVLLMLLFTYVFGGAIDPGGNYVNYVVPGIILLCAGFGASSVAIRVADDLSTGVINRFRTMPLPPTAFLTGHVVASLVRNLFATGLVIVVAMLLGFRPEAGPLAWVGAIGMVALWILAITWLFAAIGLVAGSAEAATGYGFVLLFLPYLSSAFVPVDTMPAGLAWIAENQPVTPIIETIRALLFETDLGSSGWWAVGWCLLIGGAAVVWAAWLFPRRTLS